MAYKRWFADLETSTEAHFKDKAQVIRWALVDYENIDQKYNGTNMASLYDKIVDERIKYIYFHNATFDGEFINWFLIENGFNFTENIQDNKDFKYLKDDLGVIYSIDFKIDGFICHIRDSFKLIPMSIDDIGEKIGIPKLKINYDKMKIVKGIEEVPQKEWDYVNRDVEIIATFFKEYVKHFGMPKITASATSYDLLKKDYGYYSFVNDFGGRVYNKKTGKRQTINMFSKDDYEEFIPAKRGGFSFVNEKYIGKDIATEKGYVVDLNSAHPFNAGYKKLPYGDPLKHKPKGDYRTLTKILIFKAEMKDKDMIPFLWDTSAKGKFSYDYKRVIENEVYTLIDIELDRAIKHYGLKLNENYVVLKTWYFRAKVCFKDFVDKWYKVKNETNNPVIKQAAKLRLNGFIGKLAQLDEKVKRVLVEIDDKNDKDHIGHDYGKWREIDVKDINKERKYILLNVFITGETRVMMYDAIEANKANGVLYGDTDSLVLLKKPVGIKISNKKIGHWKIENRWTRFKAYNPKEYLMQLDDGSIKRAISGLTKNKQDEVNFGNFYKGTIIEKAKLIRRRVKGGIILKWAKHTL